MIVNPIQGSVGPSPITDVGVVMFWESMRLRYANEEARGYMARVGSMDAVLSHKEDLRLSIVKLGVHIRTQGIAGMRALPNGVLATHTVRTQQGLFRLRALEVSDPFQQADQQIMIVIEDCRKERPPSTGTVAP